MKIKTTKALIDKNVLYSSGIATVISIALLALLLNEGEENIYQSIDSLIFWAVVIMFTCLCACTIYRKEIEKGLSGFSYLASFFKATIKAVIITTAVLIVLILLFEGVAVVNYLLLSALVATVIVLFISSIISIIFYLFLLICD